MLAMGLVFALVMLLYLPALRIGFVWDDWTTVLKKEYSLPDHWMGELTSHLIFYTGYYRPLPVASFIAELYFHGGPDARAMHLTNILLHALNASLVTLLAYRMGLRHQATTGKARTIAVMIGVIYGTHPALIETASWVSCRFDLLLTTFLLLALLANTLTEKKILRPLLVGSFFFLAALCKEAAATFPLVVLAWNLAWEPRPLWPLRTTVNATVWRKELPVYATLLTVGLLYLLLRHAVLGYLLESGHAPSIDFSLLTVQKLLYPAETLGRFLYTVVNPYSSIGVTHPHVYPVPLDDVTAWISIALIVALVPAVVILSLRVPRAGWLVVAFLVSILPVLNILLAADNGNITQDRFLTFPLTLFSIALVGPLLALLAKDTHRRTTISAMILLAGVFIGNIVTVRTVIPMWQSETSLWTWAVSRTPNSYIAQGNLSQVYIHAQKFDLAIRHAQNAIAIAPTVFVGYASVGQALLAQNKPEEALEYLDVAVKLARSESLSQGQLQYQIALAHMQLGHYHEAEPHLLEASLLLPMETAVNRLLYIFYAKTSRSAEREAAFDRLTAGSTVENQAEERKRLDLLLSGKKFSSPKHGSP